MSCNNALPKRVQILEAVSRKRDEELKELLLTGSDEVCAALASLANDRKAHAILASAFELAAVPAKVTINLEALAESQLVHSGVEDGGSSIPVHLLVHIFVESMCEFCSDDFRDVLQKDLSQIPPTKDPAGAEEDFLRHLNRARMATDGAIRKSAQRHGVPTAAAALLPKAVMDHIPFLAHSAVSAGAPKSVARELIEIASALRTARANAEAEVILGPRRWKAQHKRESKRDGAKLEVSAKLAVLDADDAQDYAMQLQRDFADLQERLKPLSRAEAVAYLDDPNDDDTARMTRFQALHELLRACNEGQSRGSNCRRSCCG